MIDNKVRPYHTTNNKGAPYVSSTLLTKPIAVRHGPVSVRVVAPDVRDTGTAISVTDE